MKRTLLLLTIFVQCTVYAQFTTVENLSSISVTTNTAETPQAKIWWYAGKHWCVLGTGNGTFVFRLDGTVWTEVLKLATGGYIRPDIKVAGDVTHIFSWKGKASSLYSVQYDAASNKYQLWAPRKTRADISLDNGTQVATIDIDGNGRMWIASDAVTEMKVRWSDPPYAVWSAPVTVASGTTDADLCAIVALPAQGQMGLFWTNRNTKRFGFKIHVDGADPAVWSGDEVPASQSAQNIGNGFADNQVNVKTAADGTLYCAVKTGYGTSGYPQVALLVRRVGGVWDPLYPVALNEGTNPIVVLNETVGRLKVVYTAPGGNIVYRESPVTGVSFGAAISLISGNYDYSTSIKGNYTSDVVIMASDATTAVSVRGTDGPPAVDQTPPVVNSVVRQAPLTASTSATTVTFRLTFSEAITGLDPTDLIVVTGGTASGVLAPTAITAVGNSVGVYDVEVSNITGAGSLRLDVKATGTGITDAAGNSLAGGYTSGESYTITQNAPTLSSVAIASNNANTALAKVGDQVTLSFTASEPINPPTVTIAGNAVTASAGSGNSFTATYTLVAADASGPVAFNIQFTSTGGTPGNAVSATTNNSSVTFDKTAPAVQSIVRQVPASATTSAGTLTWRITLSEPVSGVDQGDVVLTVVSGAVSATLASGALVPVGSGGNVYDVTASSVSGNGTLRLDVKATGTGIIDAAGNLITSGFTAGESYTIVVPPPSQGFTSVTPLSDIPIAYPTKDKPQAKAWKYAGKWWCVLPSPTGTVVYRLDGTSWTSTITISSKTGIKADSRVQGNQVHILLFRGSNNNSDIISLEYDAALGRYKPWTSRPTTVSVFIPRGAETATMEIDATGRMWLASAGITEVYAWWSDPPYNTWSAPLTIATNIKDDDICAITTLPGKIGILWSNQNTRLFGFKTHVNGTDPSLWSADEMPASQSALNVGFGMGDDHMNMKVAGDGTLYCAVKTSYNKAGFPQLALLVRRPSGVWDDLYPVTYANGTQPLLVFNEAKEEIKIIYTTIENGGDIVYRTSSIHNINFSAAPITLISGGGYLYNYASSTNQNYTSEVVIIVTNQSVDPMRAVSVLASDAAAITGKPAGNVNVQMAKATEPAPGLLPVDKVIVAPNPFTTTTRVTFTPVEAGRFSVSLLANNGSRVTLLQQGWTAAGQQQSVIVDGKGLPNGIYYLRIENGKAAKTIKVVLNK